MQRFFERNHDVRFDVRAALFSRLTSAKPAECRSPAATAEECFKEIAEPGSIELKLNATPIAAPLIEPAARLLALLLLPARRWLETTGLIPVCAKLVIFLALFGIA